MKITIIAVGKIKEKYLRDGISEYLKRLSRFAKVNIIEIKDRSPVSESPSDINKVIESEGLDILKHLKKEAYTIALDIEGKKMTSRAFADMMDTQAVHGIAEFIFIIGGSYGLSPQVKKAVDFRLSFSDMTFPHQLFRMMLLEQIYRAFKINHHETYHK
ncbi:MAG: 23S rRNA (pseudouridine(1915)-N(3))-methyltransferase RlmH [Eubacteriaceae bacterium]|nr:23S rRNA (pseudouridine(1915)-N(3))-methyltransferase RlmH [Eubacteriaceae bacterium]